MYYNAKWEECKRSRWRGKKNICGRMLYGPGKEAKNKKASYRCLHTHLCVKDIAKRKSETNRTVVQTRCYAVHAMQVYNITKGVYNGWRISGKKVTLLPTATMNALTWKRPLHLSVVHKPNQQVFRRICRDFSCAIVAAVHRTNKVRFQENMTGFGRNTDDNGGWFQITSLSLSLLFVFFFFSLHSHFIYILTALFADCLPIK